MRHRQALDSAPDGDSSNRERGRDEVNIKEGHPGAIFHWFFDTDQGTDHPAQLLMTLHGTGTPMRNLVRECLQRQSEFNDALGLEILFAFFDTDLTVRAMAEDGTRLSARHVRRSPAKFLFAGMGEAYPMPTGLIEMGKGKFRSERPGGEGFRKIAEEAAQANERVVPFFQTVFGLRPRGHYLLLSHRLQRTTLVFDLGPPLSLTAEKLIEIAAQMRPVARHSKGSADIPALEVMVGAQIAHSRLGAAAHIIWDAIRATMRNQPGLPSS